MHQNTGYSSAPPKKRLKRAASAEKGAVTIKCSHCENTFFAAPRLAVCPKCKRPANRALRWPLILLSLLVPPAGLLTSVLSRASQPYAATQALLISIVGFVGWGVLYYLLIAESLPL